MNKLWKTGALAVLLCLTACGGAGLDYPVVAEKNAAGVRVTGTLRAEPASGRVVLRLRVANNSPGAVQADWREVRLHTDSGLLNLPVAEITETATIAAGKDAGYRFEFHPVNDGLLYQKIGRKGALCREYRVDLSFLKGNSGAPLFTEPLALRAGETQYRDYAAQHGSDVVFYGFVPDEKEFKERHLPYWAGMEPQHAGHGHHDTPPPSLFISGEELMLSRILMKLVPYRMGGRMYLYFKLINRGDGLLLHREGCILKAGGKEYRPRNDFSAVKGPEMKAETPTRLAMTRNARLEFHFDFGPVPETDTLVLALPGLLAGNRKPLFLLDFPYRKSSGNP